MFACFSAISSATPKIVISLAATLLIALPGLSQKTREISVGPEQTAAEAFKARDKYRFEDFQDGYLITRQKKKSQALKLNFNFLIGLPQFINTKGDTMTADPKNADLAYIGKTMFIWNAPEKSYYELLMYHEDIKLAIQRTWKFARTETVYDDPRKGKSINMTRDPGNMVYSKKLSRMIRNENTVFRRDSSYVYIDGKDETFKANKSNLQKLFPGQKQQIDKYIDDTDVNFKKEEDLKMLFQFCISLAAK